MTREEFIETYCSRSGVPVSFFTGRYVALPCNCGEPMCEGWAKVAKDEESQQEHMERQA